MLGIGLVGVGFMGRVHYLAAARVPGVKVVAVCSRDAAKRAGDWTATRGNFGPEPGRVDLAGVNAYATLEELLADPAVELVDICNPTLAHPETVRAALDAGKHVFVEKPLALTLADADVLLDAAKRAGRQMLVGHVLPFFPEFAEALRVARSGELGRLVAGHLLRVIARPDWSDAIGDAAQTGGPAVDLHIHDTHFVALLAGVPERVFAGGVVNGDAVDYLGTTYLYGAGGPVLTCSSGAAAAAGRPFAHGYELYFERGTLAYHSGGQPLTLYAADGTATPITLPGGGDPLEAFAAELSEVAACVASGRDSAFLGAQAARDALALCLAESASARTGQVVSVNRGN